MPSPAPARTEIARWPKITATLHPDGAGTLTIDGRAHELEAGDLDASRTTILKRVTATAATVGRPVRLHSTDPDGDWELAVHPDGRVDELATLAAPDTPPPPAAARAARQARRAAPAARGRLARRLLAAAALLIGVAAGAAVFMTNGPATVVSTSPSPRTPATPQVVVRENVQHVAAAALTRARATRHRQPVARARRSAVRHRRAIRQARAQRAARRRAVAQRLARSARPAAAARRRPAATAQPRASAVPTSPPARARPSAPPPPPPARCGEFDLC